MKNILFVYLLAALTGCTTVYMPSGESYRTSSSPWTIVNNTGVQLDVLNGGVPMAKNLETGQVLAIALPLFPSETVVTVVGHTKDGRYVGTESHRFFYHETFAWTVTTLLKPQEPRF